RDLSRALRARGVNAPALFLIAGDTATRPLTSIGADTDDYVTEPFGLPEVVARVRALIRGSRSAAPTAFGTVRLDPVMHAVSGEAGAVSLTPTEYRVLSALAEGRAGSSAVRNWCAPAGRRARSSTTTRSTSTSPACAASCARSRSGRRS